MRTEKYTLVEVATMTLRLDPQGDGGVARQAWRAFCRAIEVPGEHSLPDVIRRARAASGRGDPESQWALRQHLENEKQTLTRIFATALLICWGLAIWRPRGRRLWALAPLQGALTL